MRVPDPGTDNLVGLPLFISYASDDQAVALHVCALLEGQGVPCWIAPRDVAPGAVWDEALVDATTSAGAFLLILTSAVNGSPYVKNEVNHAFAAKTPIFTFRVEDVQPSKSLGFYLARHHWTDGFPAPIDEKLAQLAPAVTALLPTTGGDAAASAPTDRATAEGLLPTKERFRWLRGVHAASSRWAGAGVAWLVAAVTARALVVAVVAGTAVWFATRPAPPTQASVRFQIPPPGASPAQMFTLSPDGRYLPFIATTGGPNQLWLRPMNALEARALTGTDDATYPFWSPDNACLGFFAQGKLKKIAIADGPPQTLCDATSGRGGTWNRDDVILFSAGSASPILRVSAAGGVSTAVTRLLETEPGVGHRFPVLLPDGAHYLYSANSDKPDASGVYVGSLDGSPAVRVLADTTNALFVPPSERRGSGHLLFRRENTVMAQPFDLETLKFSGDMFPVAEQVPISVNLGFGAFSASSNGTLAYRRGGAASNRELVWIDRMGKRIAAATKAGAFNGAPAISPDQRTVAARIDSGAQSAIWLQDVGRDVISRFTFRPGVIINPVWAPDGKRLTFATQGLSGYSRDIYVKPSSDGGREELLLHGGVNTFTRDWSSDGQWIVYELQGQTTGVDLWLLPLEGDRKPIPYLQTPFNERFGRFAPGPGAPRWMAYQSNESGQMQIYVQSIPPSGAEYQLSTAGGTQPAWRGDGKELFYLSTDQKLMAVPIALGANVEPGSPHELFANARMTSYAPSPDGQRFLVNVPAGAEGAARPLRSRSCWGGRRD